MKNDYDSDQIDLSKFNEAGAISKLLANSRGEHKALEQQSSKLARSAGLVAYQVALAALHSEDIWLDICSDPMWKGFKRPPQEKDRANALKYTIRLSVGFDGVAHDQIVSRRYQGMKAAFERGDDAIELGKLLDQHGGFEGLRGWEKRQEEDVETTPAKEPNDVVTLRLRGSAVKQLKKRAFRDFRVKIAKKSKRGKVMEAKVKTLHGLLVLSKSKAEQK